ncbi:MAG: NADH:flavin oxidoreductase/NADH oxidase [Acidobacteriaceae bacterium]|nr:NADH:flavin oxidoreductase/NADH oxidase [Acidobacteriaceae bacterium]
MSKLFEPLTLRGVTIRNRTMVAPMCMYEAKDGLANDFHLVHLGRYALGGWGLVMMEASAVEQRGRITHGDVGIWSDDHIEPLRRIASFLKAQGAVAGIQLGHAGRKASVQRPYEGDGPLGSAQLAKGELPWEVVGPGTTPFDEGWITPHALAVSELQDIKQSFCDAVLRAQAAGFDVIELHAAHGYLLHSFLSPLTNKREDKYGGDRDDRFRFPLEVAAAMRNLWPSDLPMFVRVSATDWVDGGIQVDDTVEFAKALREIGIDLMDCSTGGLTPRAQVPLSFGFQVPFAESVKREANIPTSAVGLITDPQLAEQIITEGKADMIAVAREALANPNWALNALSALNEGGNSEFDGWPRAYKIWLAKRERALQSIANA